MTTRRPFAIALATSAFYAGIFVTNANAEMHYLRVTLVTGQQITVTADIPAGTPADQIQIPGLPAPISSIVDLGSTESTPSPTATAPPVVTVEPTATPKPTAQPSPGASATPGTKKGSTKSKGGKTRTQTKDQDRDAVTEEANQATGKANTESLTGKVPTPTPTPTATSTPVSDDQAQPPAEDNPTFSLAEPGAAKPGVPNFFIDKFKIPPFLLPIYQAAGTEYGIRWEILAAINEIETNYGRNLNVSTAGAEGWMQFMPATWKDYGVDGNKDGLADPYSPVDAIFAAARYLKAAGAASKRLTSAGSTFCGFGAA